MWTPCVLQDDWRPFLILWYEVFTLSHAFHMESTWSPGTLPGFYLDSRYFWDWKVLTIWQGIPAKPHLEHTWSTPGIPGIFPVLYLEWPVLQATGLGRDWVESR